MSEKFTPNLGRSEKIPPAQFDTTKNLNGHVVGEPMRKKKNDPDAERKAEEALQKLLAQPPLPRGSRLAGSKKNLVLAAGLSLGLNAATTEEVVTGGKYAKATIAGAKEVGKHAYATVRQALEIPSAFVFAIDKTQQELAAWWHKRGEIKERLAARFKKESLVTDEALGLKNIKIIDTAEGQREVAPDQAGKVDWVRFYLHDEVLRGNLTEELARRKHENFKKQVMLWQLMAKQEPNRLKVLHEILQEQGDYNPDRPFLSGIILTEEEIKQGKKKQGNCSARRKFILAAATQVYPDLIFKDQHSLEKDTTGRYVGHIRQVAKVNNIWHSLEETPFPLQPDMIDGTVFHDPMNDVNEYVGFKLKVRQISTAGVLPPGSFRAAPSDGFARLPPGVRPTASAYGQADISSSVDRAVFVRRSFEAAQEQVKQLVEQQKQEIIRKAEIERAKDDNSDIQREIEKIKKERLAKGERIEDGGGWEDPDVEYRIIEEEVKKEKEIKKIEYSDKEIVDTKLSGILGRPKSYVDIVLRGWFKGNNRFIPVDLTPFQETLLTEINFGSASTSAEINFDQLHQVSEVVKIISHGNKLLHFNALASAKHFMYTDITTPQAGFPQFYTQSREDFENKLREKAVSISRGRLYGLALSAIAREQLDPQFLVEYKQVMTPHLLRDKEERKHADDLDRLLGVFNHRLSFSLFSGVNFQPGDYFQEFK